MPVGHIALPETPAEEHGVALWMLRGKIDQTLVEVLHLHAGLLELGNDARKIGGGLGGALLQFSDALEVEPAAVPGDRALNILEPAGHVDEAPAGLDEPLGKRPNDLQGVVRLFLREEPHAGMLNSAVA
jgi:hypothetical protein